MRVWEAHWRGHYCGGLAIVAADTEEEVGPLLEPVFPDAVLSDIEISLLGGVTYAHSGPRVLSDYSYRE
jgi:hypothetical protein